VVPVDMPSAAVVGLRLSEAQVTSSRVISSYDLLPWSDHCFCLCRNRGDSMYSIFRLNNTSAQKRVDSDHQEVR